MSTESLAEYAEKFVNNYIVCLGVAPYQMYKFYSMDSYVHKDINCPYGSP